MNRVSRASVALFVAAALAHTAALADPQATNPQATDTQATKSASSTDPLTEVVVTGSRIKRALSEGATPVTILTNEEITKEGFQTVADALQTLNQNTTSSFTGDLAVTGFSPNAQVVNLRNLGPGYTLTLINGRRPAQYPQPYNRDNNVVNVRAIPQAAIERIEVLTGGASAIYGADAVAGVVNIITRKDFDGNTVNINGGTTYDGGGDNINVSYTGGRTGENWSAVVALQYGQTDPIFASEREKFADLRNGPLGNFVNPSLSLIAIRASNPNANQNAFYPGQAVCDQFGYSNPTPGVPTTRGQYCGSFDQVASRSIQNASKFYSAYVSGNYDITSRCSVAPLTTSPTPRLRAARSSGVPRATPSTPTPRARAPRSTSTPASTASSSCSVS